jgi:hypothetical protein
MLYRSHAGVAAASIALLAMLTAPTSTRAAINGSLDDFQDLTLMGWSGEPTMLSVKPSGGPLGAGDAYLRVTSGGGVGPGSRLATDNEDARWIGNYLTSGITAVEADFINMSSAPLEIRSVVFSGPAVRYTSTIAGVLPADGVWHHLIFELDEGSLTNVLGSMSYTDVMSDVSAIMFRHNSGSPGSGGTAITSAMGIDNIHSIPAPAAAFPFALAAGVLRRRRAPR